MLFLQKERGCCTHFGSFAFSGRHRIVVDPRKASSHFYHLRNKLTNYRCSPTVFLTGYSEANLLVFSRLLTLFRRLLSLKGFPATFHAEFTQYLSYFPHLHVNLPHFFAFLSLRYECTFPTFHCKPIITIGIHISHISLHFSSARVHCFSYICYFVHYRILKSPRPSNTFRYRYTVILLTPAKRANSETVRPCA